jgi:hypothetical protein
MHVIWFDGQIFSFVAREINAGTLNMEPYLTAEDFNRLGVEIVFMIMVFYYILSFIFDFLAHAARGDLSNWVERYGMAYIILDCANFGIDACLLLANMSICHPQLSLLLSCMPSFYCVTNSHAMYPQHCTFLSSPAA